MKNYERRCTDPWTLLNSGESSMPRTWRREEFVQGVASPRHFFHTGLQTNIMVNGDDFFTVGRREGQKHALLPVQGAYELSKVVTLGLCRHDLGQSVSWEEHCHCDSGDCAPARPAACFPRLEGSGTDRPTSWCGSL